MSSRSRPTQAKRAREKALMEKRQMKAAKRADLKDRKSVSPKPEGIDPDIADIVPGPQPHPFLSDEELEEEQS